MEIDISRMKSELKMLDKRIVQYENCMNNVNFLLKQSSSNWVDGFSENFYSDLSLFSLHVDEFVGTLKSFRNIYLYMINRYEKIGSKVTFNLDKRKSVTDKIDNILVDFDNAILKINGFDASFDFGSSVKVNNKRNALKNLRDDTKNTKDKINRIFDEIESIESNVSRKISNIEFGNISLVDIDKYV